MLENLREKAGDAEYAAGLALYGKSCVHELRRARSMAEYIVADDKRHTVLLSYGAAAACSCGILYCRHTVAAAMAAYDSGALQEMQRRRALEAAPALLAAMESALPEAGAVILQPSLMPGREGLRLGLRIGEDRLYVVRNIPVFLSGLSAGKAMVFGKGFTLQPAWMHFGPGEKALLDILEEYFEARETAQAAPAGEMRTMLLPGKTALRVLAALDDIPFQLLAQGRTTVQTGIREKPLEIEYLLSGSPRALTVTSELPARLTALTPDCAYVLHSGSVVRLPAAQRAAVRTLLTYQNGDKSVFTFSAGETPRVLGELLPYLTRTGSLLIDPALEAQMERLPLSARVYLDKKGPDILARTVFAYGRHEIDPFSAVSIAASLLLRDAAAERAVMDELAASGFHVRSGRVYLSGSDAVYRFVTGGVSHLTACAQVYFSKEFSRLAPRRPLLQGLMRLSGGQLMLDLTDDSVPVEELLPLMQALRDRRAYFRYKDGTFISLEGMEDWGKLAQAVCEAAAQTEDSRDLGAYRAAYLHALIAEANLAVGMDEGALAACDTDREIPSPLECLRPYQLRGFRWLCSLYGLQMGGIMADEMGLGKTVQAIAAFMYLKSVEKERLPSIIVVPTSLIYNWRAELRRFAPGMDVLTASGGQYARCEQIKRLSRENPPDVYITSYPLIRRDIQYLESVLFRVAVLDEAQFVKNAASVGAHAVKRIHARARFALTGTPMENHLGELWSLFDFVLPGYLPKAQEFMRKYGEGLHAGDLLMRIRPFMIRRLKQDVLTELPDKLITTMMADMPPEQRRAYQACLMQKRGDMARLLSGGSLARGRAEVLAAIMELRQICCHPVLCLPDYAGMSGKMEMMMDVLKPALDSGRRVLIFSQFTRMLRLIMERLSTEGISCLYLDGDTPAANRQELADSFNAGRGSVFLISLKAGGTGLNLTGADMVIHYDPWWNPAAEDQAIDRAHRIGQTRVVDVVRLIMHDSIEEQVVSMGIRKRQLFDRLITPGEAMPARLSDADILSLFDEGRG
jgi:superfamily II DNA or RNA helicase